MHLAVDDQRLELLSVRSEPRVAVLPVGHPAAGNHEGSIADLPDDPVTIQRGATPTRQAFQNVDPRPDGRQPRPGAAVDNLEEKLQRPAAGPAVSFVPPPSPARSSKAGIAYVP